LLKKLRRSVAFVRHDHDDGQGRISDRGSWGNSRHDPVLFGSCRFGEGADPHQDQAVFVPIGGAEDLFEPATASGLVRYTPNTLTTPEALRREFDRIVRDGYAIDDEELHADTRCVAAPVRDSTGRVVASIGCSGPAVRLTRDRAEVIARVVIEEAAVTGAPFVRCSIYTGSLASTMCEPATKRQHFGL
jgi:hypothetical protein